MTPVGLSATQAAGVFGGTFEGTARYADGSESTLTLTLTPDRGPLARYFFPGEAVSAALLGTAGLYLHIDVVCRAADGRFTSEEADSNMWVSGPTSGGSEVTLSKEPALSSMQEPRVYGIEFTMTASPDGVVMRGRLTANGPGDLIAEVSANRVVAFEAESQSGGAGDEN